MCSNDLSCVASLCTLQKHKNAHVDIAQEARKHKRLMSKAGLLDWDDIQRIATIKGMQNMFTKPGLCSADPAHAASEQSTETGSASSGSTAATTTDADRVPDQVKALSSNEEDASDDVADEIPTSAAASAD